MTEASTHPELVLTRTFDAPRELVFAAFTDARRLAQWWGPEGFTTPDATADVRPGGALRLDMHSPDGTIYRGGGTYHEIVPPERLVFSTTILGDDDKALAEIRNTLTLVDRDGKTELTLHARVVHADPSVAHHLAGMEEGWNSSLDVLAEYLAREARGS
jgi:uncharacterized protein YndB with AHSA1/START domain